MSKRVDQCLILSGDHLYRMDYREFLMTHWGRSADVTIAVQPVTRE
jgi:glucose-1-phosphate adenylyltransferase